MDSESVPPPPYGLCTRHVYPLVDRQKNTWATLKVVSRARSPSGTPIFLSSDTIKGTVVLDLAKERKLKSIIVSVVGWISAAGYKQKHVGGSVLDPTEGRQEPGQRFLVIREDILPMRTSSGDAPSNKFIGHHELPFEIGLPPIIHIKGGSIANKDRVYDLPPSFSEKKQVVNLIYDFALDIYGAGIFNFDFNLSRPIGIISSRSPPPSSDLCSAAFRRGEMPRGPQDDHEGWELAPGSLFTGARKKDKDIFVNCKMAFLKPLVYTRGRALLFHMALESSEPIDDYLSDPSMYQVCLIRNLSREKNKPTGKNSAIKTTWTNVVQCLAMATIWRCDHGSNSNPSTARLEFWGEFSLDAALYPSFEFVMPSIQYFVVLLPFNIPNASRKSEEPLVVQPVQIVAQAVSGLSPETSYAPPDHESPPIPELRGWLNLDNIGVVSAMFS